MNKDLSISSKKSLKNHADVVNLEISVAVNLFNGTIYLVSSNLQNNKKMGVHVGLGIGLGGKNRDRDIVTASGERVIL